MKNCKDGRDLVAGQISSALSGRLISLIDMGYRNSSWLFARTEARITTTRLNSHITANKKKPMSTKTKNAEIIV